MTPRWGVEVLGGAELGARMLAERLAGIDGWTVDALTTTAVDATTWAPFYDAGEVDVHGVRVRRFPATRRDPAFDEASVQLFAGPWRPLDAQHEWFRLQGPVSDDVVDAVAASDADVLVFYPYLYDSTVRGVPLAGRRAVLHPAAHDEPPLRLTTLRRVFTKAGGLVFQTDGERRIVQGSWPIAAVPQLVLGLGISEHAGIDPGIDGPYVLCLGRVDDGKGTRVLADFFARYKQRRPGPLRLVLAGPVVHAVPEHPDITVLGAVDEDVKWGLLRGATALVNPSAYEAFSLVLVEAWTAGRPVLVNGRCEATVEHCARSGGGLWFDDFPHFEAVLDRVTGDAPLASTLGERGRRYVAEHFTWDALMTRYTAFLRQVAARC